MVHFLYYVPERRGSSFDVVEDVVPVFNLKAVLNVSQKIRKVTAVPQGKNISFKQTGNGIGFTLSELMGHKMVEVSY